MLGDEGEIAGVTIGNDVSSRDIEGANPLYLPQAKVYAGACALGPAVVSPALEEPLEIRMRILGEAGDELFAGETSTSRMKRRFEELVAYLVRDNPVPGGQRAPHRHGPRPARRLHARARPRGRDLGAGHRHALESRRPRLEPRGKERRPCLGPSRRRRPATTSAASGARARVARRTRSGAHGVLPRSPVSTRRRRPRTPAPRSMPRARRSLPGPPSPRRSGQRSSARRRTRSRRAPSRSPRT